MADSVKYEAVIFDLDGTLLDTLEDLSDSMNAVLRQLNYPTHPTAEYRYFVGDGMMELARRVLPTDRRDDVTVLLSKQLMTEEYNRRWNVKTKPYLGIAEMLDALTMAAVPMAIFSNKPDSFTQMMVPVLLPRWKFHLILGARPGVPVKPDPQGAIEIAETLEISPERILYVGDTNTDMCTATAAGMHAVGVTWGFREVEELLENGAQSILDNPLDLLKLLENEAENV